MRGVGATVRMTSRVVLMLNGHSGARGFAGIQRRAVAAEYVNRRPFWQHWNCRWRVRREFFGGVDHFAADDGEDGFDIFDFLFCHGEVVVGERGQVSELANGNCALLPTLAGKPTAALRAKPMLPRG